ncbi:MAG: hypothetical protein ACBR12_17940 [Microcoleus sp.]
MSQRLTLLEEQEFQLIFYLLMRESRMSGRAIVCGSDKLKCP